MENAEVFGLLSGVIGFDGVVDEGGAISCFRLGEKVSSLPFAQGIQKAKKVIAGASPVSIVQFEDGVVLVSIVGEGKSLFLGYFRILDFVNAKYVIPEMVEDPSSTTTAIQVNTLIKVICFLCKMYGIQGAEVVSIFEDNFMNRFASSEIEEKADRKIIKSFMEGEMHRSYDRVNRLAECVKHGNVEMVYEATQEMLGAYHAGKEIGLERSKYEVISALSIVMGAAIQGGVNCQLSYYLSDVYMEKIAQTKTLEELNQLFVQFVNHFTKMARIFRWDNREKENQGTYYVSKVKTYVNENINKNIEVIDIAESLGVTPNYLSSVFKKEAGVTILKYVSEIKVSIAKKMLVYSEYSFAEISYLLGYASQSHFCKRFKQATGMTPKEYLNKVNGFGLSDFKTIVNP